MKKTNFLLLLPALALLSSCTITIYKQNYYTTDGTQQTGGNTEGGTQTGGNTEGGGTTTGGETQGTGYGTEAAPLSVSAALNVLAKECTEDKDLTKEALYVKGSISEIKTADFAYDNGANPCAELYVTDGTQTAYVFRMHYKESQRSKIAVGTTITFCGYGKNFKGTFEFVDNGTTPCTMIA